MVERPERCKRREAIIQQWIFAAEEQPAGVSSHGDCRYEWPGRRHGKRSGASVGSHTLEQLLALIGFALATSVTPGPNNMMVTVSGANFGLRRSLPHIMGICTGFPVMVMAVGLGLGGLLLAYPVIHHGLTWIAFAYLVWLAWKLARSGRVDASGVRVAKPIGYWQAVLFQWVNPKAWIMAVSATTLFVGPGEPPLIAVGRIGIVFLLAGFPSMLAWCLFGTAIARYLSNERRIALFNGAMAVLLVVSMLPTLL